jgi:hypothetical protein
MTEKYNIHVCLSTVFCDEDLAVNVGIHRSRVVVEVRINLDCGNFEAADLNYFPDRSGDNPLAYSGHYAARDKDVLSQRVTVRAITGSSKG